MAIYRGLDFLIFVVSKYLILFSYLGIFIYIEMDHLHFDNAGILYKTHVWKVHQTSNECKLYILASKSTECCFCISTLYSASPSVVKKKKKNVNEVYRCLCVRKANISCIKCIRRFLHSFKHTSLGIWKWITDCLLILLSVPCFIHLDAIFRSKAGFSAF